MGKKGGYQNIFGRSKELSTFWFELQCVMFSSPGSLWKWVDGIKAEDLQLSYELRSTLLVIISEKIQTFEKLLIDM